MIRTPNISGLDIAVKKQISESLKNCRYSREQVIDRMNKHLSDDKLVSINKLSKWAGISQSRHMEGGNSIASRKTVLFTFVRVSRLY